MGIEQLTAPRYADQWGLTPWGMTPDPDEPDPADDVVAWLCWATMRETFAEMRYYRWIMTGYVDEYDDPGLRWELGCD